MKRVGLRKGKKRAIHLPALAEPEDGGTELYKLYTGEALGRISDASYNGEVYIALRPSPQGLLLEEIEEEGREIKAVFESGKAEFYLDNRGRAKNLKKGVKYGIKVVPRKSFYEFFERGSIPAEKGKGKRSEPDEAALKRIKAISEMISGRYAKALDSAAGIKSYLEKASLASGSLITLNISETALKGVKEWLPAAFPLLCDVEKGLPFRDSSFDLVISDALLEYIKEPHTLLGEYVRVLREGGELILLEPAESSKKLSFYPQDLWEIALWRPLFDKNFSQESFERFLSESMNLQEEERIDFSYNVWEEEEFFQKVVKFKKV